MLIRSALAITVCSVYERLASLVGVVALSRLLAPVEIGAFALAVSVLTVAGQLLDFGFHWVLIAQPTVTPATVWSHAFLQVASGAVVLFAAAGGRAFWVANLGEQFASLLLAVSLTRLVVAIGATSRVLLEKEFRFREVGVVNVVAATASLLVGILMAYNGYGVWALVVAAGPPSLLGALIQTGGFLWHRPLKLRTVAVDWVQLRRFLAAGRPLWLGTQAVAISTQLDNLVIGTMVGPAALGVYDRAYRVIQTATALVNQTFGRVALPVYARVEGADPGRGRWMQELNTALLVRLALPVAAAFTLASSEVTRVLLGPGWDGAGVLLALLAPYFVFRVLDENLLAYLLGTGRNWERTVGWLIVAGISIPALPLCVRVAGTVGAPVAVGLAMAAGMCWQQHRVGPGSLAGVLSDGLRPFLIALAAGGVTLALNEVVRPAGVAGMLTLKAALMLSGYLVLLILFDRARLRQLVGEFRNANYLVGA